MAPWPGLPERACSSSQESGARPPATVRYPGFLGTFRQSWPEFLRNRSRQKSDGAPGRRPDQWSSEDSNELQKSVDDIFRRDGRLFGLDFSFTIANPYLEDFPIIGCSEGFLKLCGYSLPEILGHNCRFLIDRVPKEQIDSDVRRLTRDFCMSVRDGKEYQVSDADRKPWMPIGRPSDELICMQTNRRKDGTLFNNMFYMKVFFLSTELGKGQPYVVALQSECEQGLQLQAVAENLDYLDGNMLRVKQELSAMYLQCSTSCHLNIGRETERKSLHRGFDPSTVQPFDNGRFKFVKKVCDATRNKGAVELLEDLQQNKVVAAKRMPNAWLCTSHNEFLSEHPNESEMPWTDIGCTQFLNSVNYPYVSVLQGVFRDSEHTYVNFSYATGGDLFSVALTGLKPGLEREASFTHIAHKILKAFKRLHEIGIVHRDISLENILLTSEVIDRAEIQLIDFAMASRDRIFCNCKRGKPSYQAPEMHEDGRDYDAFQTDAFSIGVVLYSLFFRDYPWLNTKPAADMHFQYVKSRGFRSYCQNRKARGTKVKVAACISEPLFQLLDGLLEMEPDKRLSLGEENGPKRRSVWDEPFTAQCSDFQARA